jgi:hypothetical protein
METSQSSPDSDTAGNSATADVSPDATDHIGETAAISLGSFSASSGGMAPGDPAYADLSFGSPNPRTLHIPPEAWSQMSGFKLPTTPFETRFPSDTSRLSKELHLTESSPEATKVKPAPSMQAPKKTHAYHTPENAAASPPGGSTLVFIYVDMTSPGLTWKNLNLALPDYLASAACLHQTKSGNAILAFQSSHARRGYQRLASYGQTEVMVMMDDTTLWGDRLSEHLTSSGLKFYELPVMSRDHEKQLLKFLTLMAQASGLHVAMKNDTPGTPATESTASEIQTQIDRQ